MTLKRVLTIFGWVLAGFGGLFASITGYLAVSGGFKPPFIPVETIFFESAEITIDADSEIFVYATPENTTELDIQISILWGSSIIRVPETAKIGEPILIEVIKDENEKNLGGYAKISARQGIMPPAECIIFVDIPVESFTLSSSKEGNIYVGNTFTVSPSDVYPQNSLNPSINNQNYNKPNKVVKYYSSNTNVATVDETTGLVTTIAEGTFTIEARVVKTYNLLLEEPSPEDYEYLEEYWLAMNEISVVVSEEFIVSSIAVSGITANDNELDPLYDLYLHESIVFTPSDLGLQLLPQADSDFIPSQLDYKLKDLEILVSNEEKLSVEVMENPLAYSITVLDFETWQIHHPHIIFTYNDGTNIFSTSVHFKILTNNVEEITIEKNTEEAIEVVLDTENPISIDLESLTTVTAENTEKEPTYSMLRYKIVNLEQAVNDLGEVILLYDEATGYLLDNKITPLHRGTLTIMAVVLQTDIDGNPIDNGVGGYVEIYQETENTVIINVLEELTSLSMSLKRTHQQKVAVGDTLQLEITNLNQEQIDNFNNDLLVVNISNNEALTLQESVLEGNILTLTLTALLESQVNVFVVDLTKRMFIDFVEVQILGYETELEPIIHSFDLNKYSIDANLMPAVIRGTEVTAIFEPNSYGAFIDAYQYGKLEFVSTNPETIQIYSSIDANKNIILRLVAIQDTGYSNIRAYLVESPNTFLINQRVNVDLGAVNIMQLSVNSQIIQAIPEVGGTQWLTPDGKKFTPSVEFFDPEEPAVTGVYYISSDPTILEIDSTQLDDKGLPNFIFKKAGTVTLTARSLDPYSPDAYDDILLTVNVPAVSTEFNYSNLVAGYEELIAGKDAINLIIDDIDLGGGEFTSRIKLKRYDGVDYTELAQFELLGDERAATLTEYPEDINAGTPRSLILQTNEVGENVVLQVRVYTDFGFEDFYPIKVVPNVTDIILYKDNGSGGTIPNNPEIVYPPVGETTVIRLLEVQDGVQRVNVTDKDGASLNNRLQFSLNNDNWAIVNEFGEITIWGPSDDERELQVQIYIEYDSDINFERTYNILIKPNMQINFYYADPLLYEGFEYEQIDYVSTYDLIVEGKVTAESIVPEGNDITSELEFSMQEYNQYVTISSDGILTIAPITQDQFIAIRVYNIDEYYKVYRIRIRA